MAPVIEIFASRANNAEKSAALFKIGVTTKGGKPVDASNINRVSQVAEGMNKERIRDESNT